MRECLQAGPSLHPHQGVAVVAVVVVVVVVVAGAAARTVASAAAAQIAGPGAQGACSAALGQTHCLRCHCRCFHQGLQPASAGQAPRLSSCSRPASSLRWDPMNLLVRFEKEVGEGQSVWEEQVRGGRRKRRRERAKEGKEETETKASHAVRRAQNTGCGGAIAFGRARA